MVTRREMIDRLVLLNAIGMMQPPSGMAVGLPSEIDMIKAQSNEDMKADIAWRRGRNRSR